MPKMRRDREAEQAQQAEATAQAERVRAQTSADQARQSEVTAIAARDEVDKLKDVIRAGQIAAQAGVALLDKQPQSGSLLALEAVAATTTKDVTRILAAEQSLWLAQDKLGGLGLGSHQGTIYTVAFSPDGRWLATGNDDTTARLWDLTSDDPNSNAILLQGHQAAIFTSAFSPDGRWLATGSWDRTARLMPMFLEELIDRTCRAVGRNLTADEWRQYFPGEAYHRTCPQYPPGVGVEPSGGN